MDLRQKAARLPAAPGVYLYKNERGEVIYVGKAKNLRARVRSYFSEERLADARTGSLLGEARGIDYILVDNEREALALENNLIKQYQPRFNVLLRDDKTFPVLKLTREKYPRIYLTRRTPRDGSSYFGPFLPASLAYRLLDFIHRHFQVPSCKVDLSRTHRQPCLQHHIHRCLGPCVDGLTTDEAYADAVRNVRLFLEGRLKDLGEDIRRRMEAASAALRFEEAAGLRDLLATIEDVEQKQKMAVAGGEDADTFGFHAEPPLVAVNVFHFRGGRVVDRRELFWEDQCEFEPPEFFASLLSQFYLDQPHIPPRVEVPVEFEGREALEELLSERRGRKMEIHTPQRGPRKAMLELAQTNARHSFEQRFRVQKPGLRTVQDALRETLNLPEPPRRIECFDISHIQGSDTVASMVVWQDGRMQKAGYRKYIIRDVEGVDDFASMREVVTRRYRRLQAEGKPMPDLVLVDGGVGQLHAAAEAMEALGILNQPVAAIAKREDWIYALGQEDEPVILDRFSPMLHLIQTIRDEAHRFAVTFHRARRGKRLTGRAGRGPRARR